MGVERIQDVAQRGVQLREIRLQVFSLQQQLSTATRKTGPALLEKAKLYLKPEHIEGVFEERAMIGVCGTPGCCKKPLRELKAKYLVKYKTLTAYDLEAMGNFCSVECHNRMSVYKSELSDEPIWANVEKQEDVQPEVKQVVRDQMKSQVQQSVQRNSARPKEQCKGTLQRAQSNQGTAATCNKEVPASFSSPKVSSTTGVSSCSLNVSRKNPYAFDSGEGWESELIVPDELLAFSEGSNPSTSSQNLPTMKSMIQSDASQQNNNPLGASAFVNSRVAKVSVPTTRVSSKFDASASFSSKTTTAGYTFKTVEEEPNTRTQIPLQKKAGIVLPEQKLLDTFKELQVQETNRVFKKVTVSEKGALDNEDLKKMMTTKVGELPSIVEKNENADEDGNDHILVEDITEADTELRKKREAERARAERLKAEVEEARKRHPFMGSNKRMKGAQNAVRDSVNGSPVTESTTPTKESTPTIARKAMIESTDEDESSVYTTTDEEDMGMECLLSGDVDTDDEEDTGMECILGGDVDTDSAVMRATLSSKTNAKLSSKLRKFKNSQSSNSLDKLQKQVDRIRKTNPLTCGPGGRSSEGLIKHSFGMRSFMLLSHWIQNSTRAVIASYKSTNSGLEANGDHTSLEPSGDSDSPAAEQDTKNSNQFSTGGCMAAETREEKTLRILKEKRERLTKSKVPREAMRYDGEEEHEYTVPNIDGEALKSNVLLELWNPILQNGLDITVRDALDSATRPAQNMGGSVQGAPQSGGQDEGDMEFPKLDNARALSYLKEVIQTLQLRGAMAIPDVTEFSGALNIFLCVYFLSVAEFLDQKFVERILESQKVPPEIRQSLWNLVEG